ncbi:MAG TPA: NAD(P)/FAD-dependent oxidoreductase [Phycisphaerae bacterium]|nr:NAD(P)/FAD-dependent oxidoreductase [Phycisphaerae bacterium]
MREQSCNPGRRAGSGSRGDVAIVGAGAAGLACAIFAARRLPGRSILLLDGSRHPGAKILVAGGGRCNVTNRTVTATDFSGTNPHLIRRVLADLPVERTVDFFREIGVELHEEEDGKLFPDTHHARTVLDALMSEVRRQGVLLLAERKVTGIERLEGGFRLQAGSTAATARCVVLATGGLSLPGTGSDGSGYALAQSLGHSLVEPTPALVPLVLDGGFHRDLSGVSQDVELSVVSPGHRAVKLRGPMLWTHFGVSGPVVLNASRHWHRARLEGRDVRLTVSFLPGEDFASAERRLLDHARRKPKLFLHNALAGWFPDRFVGLLMDNLGIPGRVPLAHVDRASRRRLLHALLEWPLPVVDSRGYAHAEVTAGGVPLTEIDSATMMSRKCPGLYLIGEILDVDGRIGGFNFQWAWSSAYAAAAGVAGMV